MILFLVPWGKQMPKAIKLRFESSPGLRSEAGFGLVEVMIVAAVISIIALGMSTLFTDMFSMQSKSNQQASYTNVRQRLMQIVQSSESWALTVAPAAGNADMNCIRNNTPCTSILGGVNQWYPLTLVQADGSLNGVVAFSEQFVNGTDEHGFDNAGVLCTTFNAGTPNGACALSYDLEWHPVCPGAATSCTVPAIQVRGIARFASPSIPVGGMNVARYDFMVLRGSAAIRNDPVIVSFVKDETARAGEGNCKGAWRQRQLTSPPLSDPGNNVTVAANDMTFKAGTYNCRITAPSFKAGGVRIRLRDITGVVPTIVSPTVTASMSGGSALAVIDTTFTLTADTTFKLEQYCESDPSDDSDGWGAVNPNYSMGVPIPDDTGYGAVTYSVVSCLRTS
ncbi:MAG: type II secretion system protein [Bdellovibrionaceae bacterium]|nr:type II secretion system protein [Pseudobdellovibrionaceae bacterium]